MSVLRPGLLDGLTVVLAGGDGRLDTRGLRALGATIAESAETAGATPDALVCDATGAFGAGGRAGLEALLTEVWATVQPAGEAMIAAGRGGRVLLVAPPPDAGPFAAAARAGLENLARTLSVEWARFALTACAILPGPAAGPDDLGELIAYLLSPAGSYFSGCRLELG